MDCFTFATPIKYQVCLWTPASKIIVNPLEQLYGGEVSLGKKINSIVRHVVTKVTLK